MSEGVEIYRSLFLPNGADIGEDQEREREDRYMRDFARLIPEVSRLRYSRIQGRKYLDNDGLHLALILHSTGQRSVLNSARYGGAFVDDFAREVKMMQDAVARLPMQVNRAISLAVMPAELREDSPRARQLQAIRRMLLRARSRSVLSDFERPLDMLHTPIFSQGAETTISARLVSLDADRVRLRDAQMASDALVDLADVRLPRRTYMHFQEVANDHSLGYSFYRLIRSKSIASMRVMLIWDSVTGQPHHVRFLGLLT